MAIALVNKLGTNLSASSVSTLAITSAFAVSAGDTVLVACSWNATSRAVSCTDSKGNTYTKDVDNGAVTAIEVAIFHGVITTPLTTSDTITLTWTGGTVSVPMMAAYDFSGLSSTPFDKSAISGTAGSGTTGSNPTSGSTATTSVANELLFGVMGETSTTVYTAGTNYTKLDQINNTKSLFTEYQIVSATGTYAATATAASSPYGYSCGIKRNVTAEQRKRDHSVQQ